MAVARCLRQNKLKLNSEMPEVMLLRKAATYEGLGLLVANGVELAITEQVKNLSCGLVAM